MALRWQAKPLNNDDLIDLWSGGRCMLTGLPFRETPVGGGQAPPRRAGKAPINTGAWAQAKPGLIRIPTEETMTFAYWMLIAAAMMPYLTIALAKSAGGIDNCAPRPSLEGLSGWRQRADSAHRNHFEAFSSKFPASVSVRYERFRDENPPNFPSQKPSGSDYSISIVAPLTFLSEQRKQVLSRISKDVVASSLPVLPIMRVSERRHRR